MTPIIYLTKGWVGTMTDHVLLLILGGFAILSLFLLLLNELLKQAAQIAKSWRAMIDAFRQVGHGRQRNDKERDAEAGRQASPPIRKRLKRLFSGKFFR